MNPHYRDDREAALALAEALRRDNDELRAENEYLRGLVDPGGAATGHRAVAHLQGALAATLMFLGAVMGGGWAVHCSLARAELVDVSSQPEAIALPPPALVEFEPAVAPRAPAVSAEPTVAPAAVTEAVEAPRRRHRHHHHHHGG